jgi:hypothetical protein
MAKIRVDAIGGSQVMGIYRIKVVPNGEQTEIAIAIQTPAGYEVPDQYHYYCNLAVIGTPLA